jgi:hypothetical protein
MSTSFVCRTTTYSLLLLGLLFLSTSIWGQAPPDTFKVDYYSNNVTGAPDGEVRLINPGNVSSTSPSGDLCAAVYVFDDREEFQECCSCKLTPNQRLILDVKVNLTSNTLTSIVPAKGAIKIISSTPVSGVCDPRAVTPTPTLREWHTHIQFPAGATTYSITETESSDTPLGADELAALQADCAFGIILGSGKGVCTCVFPLPVAPLNGKGTKD